MTYFAKVYQKSFEDTKPEKAEKKKPKPIRKQSVKAEVEGKVYSKERKVFLEQPENKKCFIEECKRKANTVEHIKGRKGFADEEARAKGISLLLDKRYWKPCCLQHNLELENNTELSKKYQLSRIHEGAKI